ncbi:hypothetical protein FDECE_2742 [Fusarium decemcellulare]|nr:hypothetical protein FDECE_2742 [Fusarium decemcellulare]
MGATIDTLPAEVLVNVFASLDCSQNGGPAAGCCLRVCRRWRDLAHRYLHEHLVIVGNRQLERFVGCHDRQATRSITRSLTVRLRLPSERDADYENQVNRNLFRLSSHAVVHMAKLESFSLTTHHKWSKCSINSSTIRAILKALPTSCVNLELDIRTLHQNWGCSSMKHWGTHACHELRRLLPRMHNVRLNLPDTCDAILGTRERGDGFADVRPISLPCMRNLQIDCGSGQGSWQSIIRALQSVLELEETNAAEVTVLTSNLNQQKPCYSTLLRCHVRPGDGTTTWSFPITHVPPPPDYRGSDVLYMRTDNGDFVTFGGQAAYDLARGRPWRLLSTGVRLPATFPSDTPWVPDEELGILTETQWLERYPKNQPILAINERETGMRLIDAEERNDTEYRCAVEMTPEGWVRPYTGTVRSMLFREADDRSNLPDLVLLGFDTDAALPQPTRGSRPTTHFDRMWKLGSNISPFLGSQELGF